MKKIFASIVLPNLAAAAIIGSGFSVWFFGENQDKASTTASIKVENCVKINEVRMYEGEVAVLHLDQTKGVRSELLKAEKTGKSDFGRGAFGVEANGIYLAPKKGVKDDTTGGEKNITNINYDQTTNLEGTCKLELVTEFKFEGGVKDFVGMKNDFKPEKGTMDTPNSADGVVVYTFKWATVPTSYNYAGHLPVRSGEDTSGGNAIDFAFEYLEYNNQYTTGKDAKRGGTETTYAKGGVMATAEPHNDAEYSEMLNKIGDNSKLIITTTATIVAV